jgi:hypothetical protein
MRFYAVLAPPILGLTDERKRGRPTDVGRKHRVFPCQRQHFNYCGFHPRLYMLRRTSSGPRGAPIGLICGAGRVAPRQASGAGAFRRTKAANVQRIVDRRQEPCREAMPTVTQEAPQHGLPISTRRPTGDCSITLTFEPKKAVLHVHRCVAILLHAAMTGHQIPAAIPVRRGNLLTRLPIIFVGSNWQAEHKTPRKLGNIYFRTIPRAAFDSDEIDYFHWIHPWLSPRLSCGLQLRSELYMSVRNRSQASAKIALKPSANAAQKNDEATPGTTRPISLNALAPPRREFLTPF